MIAALLHFFYQILLTDTCFQNAVYKTLFGAEMMFSHNIIILQDICNAKSTWKNEKFPIVARSPYRMYLKKWTTLR